MKYNTRNFLTYFTTLKSVITVVYSNKNKSIFRVSDDGYNVALLLILHCLLADMMMIESELDANAYEAFQLRVPGTRTCTSLRTRVQGLLR